MPGCAGSASGSIFGRFWLVTRLLGGVTGSIGRYGGGTAGVALPNVISSRRTVPRFIEIASPSFERSTGLTNATSNSGRVRSCPLAAKARAARAIMDRVTLLEDMLKISMLAGEVSRQVLRSTTQLNQHARSTSAARLGSLLFAVHPRSAAASRASASSPSAGKYATPTLTPRSPSAYSLVTRLRYGRGELPLLCCSPTRDVVRASR